MDLTNLMTWGTALVATQWIIRLVMVVVIPFRRSPDAAKAWLLLVLFMPWVGLALYLLIGRPKYPQWRAERFAKLAEVFGPVRRRLADDLAKFSPTLSEPLASTAILAQNLGRYQVVAGNDVELLGDYDDAIDRLVADIDRAAKHVHLLFYIFADDATGSKVVSALERAARRGVKARVLVDFVGSLTWWGSLSEKLTTAGVTVHQALPVGLLWRRSARADLRNHRKLAVIDGRIAYTGSQNLADATFKKGVVFKDLIVRVTGPVVLQCQAVFAGDWYMETEEVLDASDLFPSPQATGSIAAQILASGPDYLTANVHELVLTLIYGAKDRVVITTPYFVPDKPLLVALDTAVRRGVEVHLVVSRTTDERFVRLAQKSYYQQLLESGVRIHVYRGEFLHSKHMSVDGDVFMLGTSNMDIRSFVLNAEISLIVFDEGTTSRLREHQRQAFARSDVLTLAEWSRRSLASKVVQNFARLMSPLL